nr:uncharacterized protein LOC110003528 [Labrus bergylta]
MSAEDVLAAPGPDLPWLPVKMRMTIPLQDQRWISAALWRNQRLRTDLKLWYEPPGPALIYHQAPTPERFFNHRLLVWMPYHLWKVRLTCPVCGKQLVGYGAHKRARQVLDVDRYYLMVTETLRCNSIGCKTNYLSSSKTILDQLDLAHRLEFRLILTQKYACDIRVIRFLRERTLGNSPSRLVKQLRENHSEEWLQRLCQYLGACSDFVGRPSLFPVVFQDPPEPVAIPTYKWMLAVYGRDILSRLEHIKASITSTFGSILKMDSTKKITRKLSGIAKGTALWLSSVSNEVGQILISVLTAQEGSGLDLMVADLIRRYREAGVAPPKLLYVDCGCCKKDGEETKLKARFGGWPDVVVKLDIYHFMRRLASGCTKDAHPLYPIFMARLSCCIFEWDAGDVALLRRVKREQLKREGVPGITDSLVNQNIRKSELVLYCRRRTRGEKETISMIDLLLQELMGEKGSDFLGVPLLDRDRMANIWEQQRKHVKCIQDEPGVPLYTETGSSTKEGIVLTTYRCARGSTSLESFHCHLARFIPGTSANSLNFQLYLLEGLNRWNQDRGAAALAVKPPSLLTYSGDLVHCVNTFSVKVLGRKLAPSFQPPAVYTGELIGIDYLYRQTGRAMQNVDPETEETEQLLEDVAVEEPEDEGFDDGGHDPTFDIILPQPVCMPSGHPAPTTSMTSGYPAPTTSMTSGYPAPTTSMTSGHPAPTTSMTSGHPAPTTSMTSGHPAPTTSITSAPPLTTSMPSGHPAPTTSMTSGYPAPTTSMTSGYPAPTTSMTSGHPAPTTSMTSGHPAPTTSMTSGHPAPTTSMTSGHPAPTTTMPSAPPAPITSMHSSPTDPTTTMPSAPPAPTVSEQLLAVDEHNMPGMDRVDSLAEYLVGLRNETSLTLSNQQTSTILSLWQNLLPFDQQRVVYAARYQERLKTGYFRSPKNKLEFTPGAESMRRCVLGSSGSPAQWPDCCRLVEAIFVRLCQLHKSPKKKGKGSLTRWSLMLKDYRKVRQLVRDNGALMKDTTLQLYEVNQTTLTQWHNHRVKRQDLAVLLQGVNLPAPLPVAPVPLPPALGRPTFVPQQCGPQHVYSLPKSTAGQALLKRKHAAPHTAAPATVRPKVPIQRQLFPLPAPLPTAAPALVNPTPAQSPLLLMLAVPSPRPIAPDGPLPPPPPSQRPYNRQVEHNKCRKCHQPRNKDSGHRQFHGYIYCPTFAGMPLEQWLEEMRRKRAENK